MFVFLLCVVDNVDVVVSRLQELTLQEPSDKDTQTTTTTVCAGVARLVAVSACDETLARMPVSFEAWF